MRESSPAGVLDRVRAPTLLIQGTADSLFPLSHADANAAGIAATGTPVRVVWFTGGHDGGPGPASERERLRRLTAGWLDHYVAGTAPRPPQDFTWSRISGLSTVDRGVTTTGYAADAYPGLGGDHRLAVEVTGAPRWSSTRRVGSRPPCPRCRGPRGSPRSSTAWSPTCPPTCPAPAGAPPLVVRALRKEYPGGLAAVDGVDLTVEAGQVVGLLGPDARGRPPPCGWCSA